MKIALFTNTYLPHIGGVARSVKTLEDACRRLGHQVRIVAPEFDGSKPAPDVLRVPAIQNFNGSDFSVQLPVPNVIRDFMDRFQPDLIHSHHPFLLGDAALREYAVAHSVAAKARIVAEDEFETTGKRALLNLGHTFGHALEAQTGF